MFEVFTNIKTYKMNLYTVLFYRKFSNKICLPKIVHFPHNKNNYIHSHSNKRIRSIIMFSLSISN